MRTAIVSLCVPLCNINFRENVDHVHDITRLEDCQIELSLGLHLTLHQQFGDFLFSEMVKIVD